MTFTNNALQTQTHPPEAAASPSTAPPNPVTPRLKPPDPPHPPSPFACRLQPSAHSLHKSCLCMPFTTKFIAPRLEVGAWRLEVEVARVMEAVTGWGESGMDFYWASQRRGIRGGVVIKGTVGRTIVIIMVDHTLSSLLSLSLNLCYPHPPHSLSSANCSYLSSLGRDGDSDSVPSVEEDCGPM